MAKNKKDLPQQPGAIVSGKWFTKKKIIAASVVGVVVIAAIILTLVLAFNWIRPIESTEEEARVVGTVGNFEVRYEELRYITLTNRADLDSKYGRYDTLSDSDKAIYVCCCKIANDSVALAGLAHLIKAGVLCKVAGKQRSCLNAMSLDIFNKLILVYMILTCDEEAKPARL